MFEPVQVDWTVAAVQRSFSRRLVRYELGAPWIALNQENHARYRTMSGDGRRAELMICRQPGIAHSRPGEAVARLAAVAPQLLQRAPEDVLRGEDRAVVHVVLPQQLHQLADPREQTCYAVVGELLANKGLSDATYAAAEKTLGLPDLVALVATTGSFSMTCMTAATFLFKRTL